MLKPPCSGDDLKKNVDTLSFEEEPIIDEFLYKGDVMMIAADAGVGKSTILLQICMALSVGEPIFGFLKVPKPVKVYYIQTEGNENETYRRMHFMQEVLNWNPSYLCIDAKVKGMFLSLGDTKSEDTMVERVKTFMPEVIVVDPIYKIARVKTDDGALALIRFSDRLTSEVGTSNIFAHHTHRPTKDREGYVIEDEDPFYGSSFLKNHVNTSYLLKQFTSKSKDSPVLICKKDRGTAVIQSVKLQYHHETFTCSYSSDPEKLNKGEMVEAFLRECIKSKRNVTSEDICQVTGCSTALLRKNRSSLEKSLGITISKSNGKRNIWICG